MLCNQTEFKNTKAKEATRIITATVIFASTPSARSKNMTWTILGWCLEQKYSHVADTLQEMANQACMLVAEVPLKSCLLIVFNVTHFDPAGMPVYVQVPQKGAKDKVVPRKFARGEKVQQRPELRIQEDYSETLAGQRQVPPTVFIQKGKKMKQALLIKIRKMHGIESESIKQAFVCQAEI